MTAFPIFRSIFLLTGLYWYCRLGYYQNVGTIKGGRGRQQVVVWGLGGGSGLTDPKMEKGACVHSLPEMEVAEAAAAISQLKPDLLICDGAMGRKLVRYAAIGAAFEADAEANGGRRVDGEEISAEDREVLLFVSRGMKDKEIAAGLGMRERTLKSRLARLFRLFDVTDRTELAMAAKEQGFLEMGAKGAGSGE